MSATPASGTPPFSLSVPRPSRNGRSQCALGSNLNGSAYNSSYSDKRSWSVGVRIYAVFSRALFMPGNGARGTSPACRGRLRMHAAGASKALQATRTPAHSNWRVLGRFVLVCGEPVTAAQDEQVGPAAAAAPHPQPLSGYRSLGAHAPHDSLAPCPAHCPCHRVSHRPSQCLVGMGSHSESFPPLTTGTESNLRRILCQPLVHAACSNLTSAVLRVSRSCASWAAGALTPGSLPKGIPGHLSPSPLCPLPWPLAPVPFPRLT
jgi:hypothetical protein